MALPGATPKGATYFQAYATSDVYVGVPAMLQGGSATYVASIANLALADLLILEPPSPYWSDLSVSMIGYRITAVGQVSVFFRNNAGVGVTAQTAQAWRYKWWDMTQQDRTVLGQDPT